MGTNHGGVNFGRRSPPIGGQFSTLNNNQRQQRLRIPRLEHQAVVLVTLAEGVDEILAPDLVGPEAVRRVVLFQMPESVLRIRVTVLRRCWPS